MNRTAKRNPLTNSNFGSMGWILVVFYFFALFFDVGLTADGAQMVIPALAEGKGWAEPTLLYWNSIAGYLALIAYIPLGIWAQKASVKVQATILTILGGISYILLGIAPSIPVYAICLCMTVICSNGRCWISYAKLTSNWFPRKKGIVMGWTTIGNNASSMLMIPLMAALIAAGGVRLSCLVLGIAMIVLGIIAHVLMKETPEECGHYPDNITPEQECLYNIPSLTALDSESKTQKGSWTTVGILKTKEFWIIAIACALMMCGSVCSIIYSTVRIQEFGFSQGSAILINSIFALLACVGSIVWGWIDQKWGTKIAVIGYCIVFAVGFFLNTIAAHLDHNIPLMFVSIFLFYWCIGGTANWPVSLCASLFGRADFMKAQTPLTIIFTAGRMTGFSVIAFGMSLTGGSLDGGFIISGVLFVVAVIVMLFLNVNKFTEKHPLT